MRRIVPGILLAALAGSAVAQEVPQPEPQPPPVVVRPGTGPQIPFDETRWEFWWYFNREPYLALRPALTNLASQAAESDEPFYRLTEEDRESRVIPALVQALRDPNPELRVAALHALAKTQDEGARVALRSGLRDSQFLVGALGVVAFGVYSSTVFLSLLEDVLDDDTRELQEREYAAVAIGLVGGPSVAESLKQYLAPPAFRARPTILQAGLAYGVGLTRDPGNAPLVRTLLADTLVTDYVVRSYLVLSLGKCGEPQDQQALMTLLADPEVHVRRSAAIALGTLLRGGADPEAAAKAVEALKLASHKDADLMVRNFAYISLGKVGGDAAAAHLKADLETTTKAHRPFIALALGILGKPEHVSILLKHFEKETDNSYRGALAIAIGLHRDNRAAPALRKAFQAEQEPVLRGYLALALGLVGDVESVTALEKVFQQAVDVEFIPNAAIALGLLGARASQDVLVQRALKEKNEYIKQSLLYGLGLIGDRAAIEPLRKILLDPAEPAYVRAYAATALGQLTDPEPVRAISRISFESNYTITTDFLDDLFRVL